MKRHRIVMVPTPAGKCACPETDCPKPAANGRTLCAMCEANCLPHWLERKRTRRRRIAYGIYLAILVISTIAALIIGG